LDFFRLSADAPSASAFNQLELFKKSGKKPETIQEKSNRSYDRSSQNSSVIRSVCKKRRGRSKYLLSVDITVGDKAIPAKSLSYDALIESVMEYFHITEQQLEEFTSSCCSKTAKVQAKSIGEWFHSCLITIL